MAKTVKVTTDNVISLVDIPWNLTAQEKEIGARCTESVKTQIMYEMFGEMVVMIVDESGLVNGRPVNLTGSYLYGTQYHGTPIVGDIIFGVRRGPDIFPPDNPEEMLRLLMRKFTVLQEERGERHR